jgi:hypothetical protein
MARRAGITVAVSLALDLAMAGPAPGDALRDLLDPRLKGG